VTFPLGRPVARHDALPQRPARTSQREKPPHRVLILFTRPYSKTVLQTISITDDAVHIRRTRDGRLVGGFYFKAGEQLDELEHAIVRARAIEREKSGRVEGVARLRLPIGVEIELGAGSGQVLARLVLANGEFRGRTRIGGEELAALERAVAEIRKSFAAQAAASERRDDK
jgi:hypothetical protein